MLNELDVGILVVVVFDVLGVVYLLYWLQGYCKSSFQKHLIVINEFYSEPRYIDKDNCSTMVSLVLNKYRLENEHLFFKMAMVANLPRGHLKRLLNWLKCKKTSCELGDKVMATS